MPMRPLAGRRWPTRQRKSWSSSSALGCLNECTSHALRIEAAHHVLDQAVLAGGVHRLQHDQHRPAVCGVEPLLQIGQPLDALGEHGLGLALVDGEAVALGRIVLGQPKLVRPVDAKAFGDAVELHGVSSTSSPPAKRCARKARDEARHRRVEVGRRRARCGYRRVPAASRGQDDRACARARSRRPRLARSTLICAISAPSTDRGPSRLRAEFGGVEPGLLLELAPHAEIEIDFAVHDVVRVGRAAGK